jgi:chromosomal replication initiation ATPase DnaA
VSLPRLHEILAITASACGVTVHEMLADGRHPNVVLARRVFTVVAKDTGIWSFPDIAKGMGKRHPTAHDCYRKAYMAENWPTVAPLARHVERIIKGI